MKSNNITTDRTLNALRRHLSRTLVLLSLLTLGVGQMWGAWYVRGSGNSWGATQMTQSSSNSNLYYLEVSGAWEFKLSSASGSWTNERNASHINNSAGYIISLSGSGTGNISGGGSGETWYICYNSSTSKVYAVHAMNIAGNNFGSPAIGSWSTSGKKMNYDGNNTFSITINSVTVSGGTFKITRYNTNSNWNNAVGYSSKVTCNYGSVSGESGDGSNIIFTPTIAGNVTITYNKSTGNITIDCPVTPTISLSAPSSGVRGESVTLTATPSNASTPTIYYEYSTNSTFASNITEINHTTSTSQSWTIPSGTSGTTYYLRAKMQVSSTWYYSSILTLTAYGKKTIHVKNTNGWASMYLYLYSDSGEKEAWHGSTTGISSYGGQWKTVVLTSQWPYFILNDNGSNQIKGDKTYKYADMTDGNCYAISSGTGNALTLSSATCPTAPTSVTTTAAPTSITNTGMTVHGNIGGNGNDNITDYGFYYGTSSTPGTKAQVGTTNKTGAISKALTGLTAGTTYYFRTYATNGQGTTYGTTYSYKIPYSVTVTKSTGCESITPAAGSYYYNVGFTVTAVAAAGYTFSAWTKTNGTTSGASSPSTGTNTVTFTPTANSATITATYTANTYTISFSNSGTGYGSGGQTATKTATYNAAMPAVTAPTASTGYKFMGYFDAAGGEGTQYYTSTGTSAHVWDKTSGATLYAHYEPATITSVTLNHEAFEYESAASGDADKDYVSMTANPTITPSGYVTPINVTWELQYSNGNPVVGHDPIYEATYRAKFSIVGLARGTYQLHATVRTGSTRGSGTVISTYDKPFQIASDYDVTVQYMCEGVNIAPSTTIKGKPLVWSDDITAPTLFGYTFARWDAGDGIVIKNGSSEVTTSTANPIKIKATFDGTLTAVYTKKNIVYFKNTLNWSNVYVYFYGTDGYWNATNGAGSKGVTCNTMTQITGTNVWYFEYTGTKNRHIAFTKDKQVDYENFYNTEAAYPTRGGTQTDSEFSNRGFNAATPMFVPTPQNTPDETKNGTKYYNDGYWTTYVEGTGYTLKIYNQRENGRVELKSIPFVASGAGNEMPYTVEVDLEAGKTYGFKFERADGIYYYNGGSYTISNNGQEWEFPYDNSDHYATGLQTNASGTYKFTLSCNSTNGNLYINIKYPAKVGDFRLNYTDNATWSHGSAHTINTWQHPSKVIPARANGVDTVSFFVSKGTGITAKIRWEKVSAVAAGSVTWGTVGSWNTTYTSVSEPGVYNFRVVQNAAGTAISTITNIGKYDGNYYIRVDAVAGKWDSYRTDHDHLMTYTEFSENRSTNTFGELYSHYKAKWCPRNTNIKFCIANDYSPCISDTLTEDIGTTFSNMTSGGTLKYEENGDHSMKYPDDGSAYLDKYSANVRFMWNRTTNKISRAYVAAATSNEARFLVLQGSGTTNSNIFSSAGNSLTANPPGANAIKLQDDQNWIYETTIMANPSALIKLYATYNNVRQYFCGTSDATFVNGTTALELLGGSASSTKYSVRVIYDFKTNRLVCAWIPTGHTQDITGNVILNSDVMFVREHQEEAQCITFSNPPTDKLSQVKTVYGSMKFNRWILGNRANPTDTDPDHCDTDEHLSENHPPLAVGAQLSQYERALYFISFPFNVKLSEVFGFGQYGVHWVIEYYDGLTRAQKGYWIDSEPNWKFVDPDMAETYVLQKGVGYILCLNLSRMAYNDREFWSNNISETELFFPSQSTISEITAVNETIPALSEEYKCTINRPGTDGDRRIKDSYWRCIGVPGYSTYNGSLTTSGSAITWKTDDTGEFDISKFPFLYAWNTADNSLTAQATTNYRFKATHAYLVQNGNQIVWSKGNFRNSIVARRQKAEDIINTDWRLTISRDDQMEDQAFIRMSDNEDVTEEFDFGQDLVKELNSGRSNIYSYIGYERCAANSMPINTTSTTTVPLGVKVPETGDYTIALPDGASGINLTLLDTETGNRTNLSAGLEYTLTLEAGDYNDRFFLEIAPIQHIATGIDEINGEANGSTHKVLINGILYIVRDGKIFDARGSRVE